MMDARVLVVGSGPAAAAAALTLLEQGIPVTMLESGLPRDHGLVVRALGRNIYRRWPKLGPGYSYTVSGDPRTRWLSALAPGGLSNLWTGAVPRFHPRDFDEGARLHERYRWPVTYNELAPYYTRMEQLVGTVGEQRAVPQLPPPECLENNPLPAAWRGVADHAEAFGQGLVRVPIADGTRWMARRSGHAFNSFQGVIKTFSSSPHFELKLGAHVTRLEWNPRTRRVDAVRYVDRATGTVHHARAAAVVVAAGPLASTKLLLQSTSADFPDGLGNTHGVLGRFLHDHPHMWSMLELERGLPMLDHNVYLTRAPYADVPPLMGAGVVIGAVSKWDRVLSLGRCTTRRFGVVTFGTMVPTRDNEVGLHPTLRDEFGLPVLNIHLNFGPDIQDNLRESHQRLQSVLTSAGYANRLTTPIDELTPGWASHYGGTVRMHASPEFGMLDGWNRLHAVDNVAVVDASSFTTGPEKNPTLTVMALASRAAERLANDLTHGDLPTRKGVRRALSTVR